MPPHPQPVVADAKERALFPPAGFVDRDGALAILGIGSEALKRLYKSGRVRCGKEVAKPGGGWCKIYPVEELIRVRDERNAELGRLPEGYVRIAEAAARFGLSASGWKKWVAAGRVEPGTWVKVPGLRPRVRAYTAADLDEIARSLEAAGKHYPRPKFKSAAERAAERAAEERRIAELKRGTVSMREACEMFGVVVTTWRRWQAEGHVTGIEVKGAFRYDRAMLERLLAECGRLSPPYPDPDRPGCWRVPLAGWGMRRREAIVDAETMPLIEGRNWYFTLPPGRPGDIDQGDATGGVSLSASRPVLLRRLILGITDPRLRVSHFNRDPLDCRRENLVVRDPAQTVWANRKPGTVNGRQYTSRFKGVCWDARNEKWIAQISKDGVGRKIGRFHDEIAAAQAYDDAAKELFGEHARLNFPDGVDARLEQESRQEQEPTREAA